MQWGYRAQGKGWCQTYFAMKWVPGRRFQHYSMWIRKLKQLSCPNHSTCEEKTWDSNSSKLFRICVLLTTVTRAVWHLQGIALVAWCCISFKVCQLHETPQDETLEEEWVKKMLAVGNDGTLQSLRPEGPEEKASSIHLMTIPYTENVPSALEILILRHNISLVNYLMPANLRNLKASPNF